uniref:Uncharacterized protein n=1 Tax=Lepeophtheirus salmonis TaxID=72036 RepID=A0A0K2VAV7_LEPSM
MEQSHNDLKFLPEVQTNYLCRLKNFAISTFGRAARFATSTLRLFYDCGINNSLFHAFF